MTTIQPNYNYMTQQPIQTVAPTAGTPNNMVNPNQPQTTYTQQPVQQQVVNTTDPAQLQQIQQRQQQLQQQYVGQIPQTTPQQQTSTAPQYDVSTPSSINRMVQDFSNEANDLITKTNVPPAPQQIQQPVQQTTT
ncbi:MAG: hypothetical protein LW809_02810, partial [Vampirovibrionales bacterium]|nr:hypothetical protein [Vampirovibrionales bacterium]